MEFIALLSHMYTPSTASAACPCLHYAIAGLNCYLMPSSSHVATNIIYVDIDTSILSSALARSLSY
jgi:hypothetical protein